MIILIRNLAKFVTEENLKIRFSKFGAVGAASIVTDDSTKETKRFAFVEMPDQAEATAAIKAMHRTKLLKETIRVKEANPKFGPDYYAGNKKPQTPTRQSVPARPAYESYAQKEKPEFKFGAKRRQATDKRDYANSQFAQRNTSRSEYKPRSERPYGRHSSGKSNKPYGHFQKRDDTRPASSPHGERSYGYQGSKDRTAQTGVGFPHRDTSRPEYKPRGERPYGRHNSGEGNKPYGHFQKRDSSRPASAPTGERSYGYHGSKERSAQTGSGFPHRDASRPEYKPQSKRPFGRNSSREGNKPYGHFQKRIARKSGTPSYGQRTRPK